jgi:hypothetical protein
MSSSLPLSIDASNWHGHPSRWKQAQFNSVGVSPDSANQSRFFSQTEIMPGVFKLSTDADLIPQTGPFEAGVFRYVFLTGRGADSDEGK